MAKLYRSCVGLMDSGSGAYSVLCLAGASDWQQRGSGRSLALEHTTS